MRKLVMAATAAFAIGLVAVSSAEAQEQEAEAHGEMGKMADSHWMKGTMTPPDSESMDVKYELVKGDDGVKGWIVGDDDGEEIRIAMKDLTWEGDYVSYNWSPPDQASLVISCKLMKQDDGAFAGDCTDNGAEGKTGQMTMAPMKAMDSDAAEKMEAQKKKMKEMDETDG